MTEKYFTVDQIADLLKIHPKTVQRYIREGRLKANKLGKSWRVSGHDLSIFTEGGSGSSSAPVLTEDTVERGQTKVSAVIDVPVFSTDESVRIANTITAIANSKPSGYGASSVQTQYLISEKVMRIMVWGSLSFTQIILDSLAALTDNQERDREG